MSSELPTPNWCFWGNLPNVEIWQAVALSLDVAPESLEMPGGFDPNRCTNAPGDFNPRLAIAINNLAQLGVNPGPAFRYQDPWSLRVDLERFGRWADNLPCPWEMPAEMPPADGLCADLPATNSGKSDECGRVWPWGTHETLLLQKLAEAAHEWWSTYDPEDPSTAPTNNEVKKWLVGKGVSDRNAEVMATILRADGIKTGPRTSNKR